MIRLLPLSRANGAGHPSRNALGIGFLAAILACLPLPPARATDLGNGFTDHGVASPISHQRGTVVTRDGKGREVVLSWLFDHRGGYALLLVDCESGASEEFPMPFNPEGDCPYASILSSGNRFYTLFNGHLVEFDPVARSFTHHQATSPKMAMAMTEDDEGVIWAVTYPASGLVSFNPRTRALVDYGSANAENWAQYPRSIAADDAGWVYFALGNAHSQIVMFDPATRKATPALPEDKRQEGVTAYLYRDRNGKIYGQARRNESEAWYEFHRGACRPVARAPLDAKPIIAGDQNLFHAGLADGGQVKSFDLVQRRLTRTEGKTGKERAVPFDYSSDGALIMGVAAAPDGTLCGGTAFPMRFFSFDPKADAWINRPAYGQFNTVARQGKRMFFGGYMHGFLLAWDPTEPWQDTSKANASNPRFLTDCANTINRPHRLLALPDGKTLILAGTPGYGYTGGGMLFWDQETGARTLLTHAELLPDQSTTALAALPDGKVLGGTTTEPGTGGEKKATVAELYVIDPTTHRVEWRGAALPGVQEYSDLCMAGEGVAYGIADRRKFFIFDWKTRKVLHEEDLGERFGPTTGEQCPRIFVRGEAGAIFLLMEKNILQVTPGSHAVGLLAKSPVTIRAGGDFLDGRLFFTSGSHLCSYTLPR